MSADPGLEPLATWTGQADLYERHLGVVRTFRADWGDTDGMMSGTLQRIPGLGLPSLMLVAALLGGYLMLVGPLNYIILKKMDRRELAWVTVPLLSVRRTPLLGHLITVTEFSPGTSTAIMRAYLGFYAPSRNSLTLALENARLVKPFSYGGGPELADASVLNGILTARVVNRMSQTVTGVRVFNSGFWPHDRDRPRWFHSFTEHLITGPTMKFRPLRFMLFDPSDSQRIKG